MKRIFIFTLLLVVGIGLFEIIDSASVSAVNAYQDPDSEYRTQANLLRSQTLLEYYGYDPAQLVLSGGETSQKNLLEPSIMFLLGLGMMGLASFRRRFKG